MVEAASYGSIACTKNQFLWTWTKKCGTLGLPTIYAGDPGERMLREWFPGSGDSSRYHKAVWHTGATPGVQRGHRGSGRAGLLLPRAAVWFALKDAHRLSLDAAECCTHLNRSQAASGHKFSTALLIALFG